MHFASVTSRRVQCLLCIDGLCGRQPLHIYVYKCYTDVTFYSYVYSWNHLHDTCTCIIKMNMIGGMQII